MLSKRDTQRDERHARAAASAARTEAITAMAAELDVPAEPAVENQPEIEPLQLAVLSPNREIEIIERLVVTTTGRARRGPGEAAAMIDSICRAYPHFREQFLAALQRPLLRRSDKHREREARDQSETEQVAEQAARLTAVLAKIAATREQMRQDARRPTEPENSPPVTHRQL